MKRRGLIAALLGLLPAFRVFGQEEFGLKGSNLTINSIPEPNPLFVSFHSEDNKSIFAVGWDTKTSELVVKADNREIRIPSKEIMDALGAH